MRAQYCHRFGQGTTRDLDYFASSNYRQFLLSALLAAKQSDRRQGIAGKNLHKRTRRFGYTVVEGEPQYGQEYFFSNVLVKVLQTPILFMRESEADCKSEGSFLVLTFEKLMKKRGCAKSQSQHAKLRQAKLMTKRYEEEQA